MRNHLPPGDPSILAVCNRHPGVGHLRQQRRKYLLERVGACESGMVHVATGYRQQIERFRLMVASEIAAIAATRLPR
ncbi:MAG: hypothetical protein ABSD96_14775 [Candidatus Korobacteraceae bacterium]